MAAITEVRTAVESLIAVEDLSGAIICMYKSSAKFLYICSNPKNMIDMYIQHCILPILVRFATNFVRFDTILVRFATNFVRFDTILVRFDTILVRFDTILVRFICICN